MSASRLVAVIPTVLLGALLVVPSCSSSSDKTSACAPADVRACACESSVPGRQTCTAAGDGYGSCVCDPSDGGSDAASDPDAGGDNDADASSDAGDLLPFLSSCSANEQCDTMLCYPFPSKGSHCTTMCAGDGDCPAPSPGCNPMGICRAP